MESNLKAKLKDKVNTKICENKFINLYENDTGSKPKEKEKSESEELSCL